MPFLFALFFHVYLSVNYAQLFCSPIHIPLLYFALLFNYRLHSYDSSNRLIKIKIGTFYLVEVLSSLAKIEEAANLSKCPFIKSIFQAK